MLKSNIKYQNRAFDRKSKGPGLEPSGVEAFLFSQKISSKV